MTLSLAFKTIFLWRNSLSNQTSLIQSEVALPRVLHVVSLLSA